MVAKNIVVANWKMHKTLLESVGYLECLMPLLRSKHTEVWIAPPCISLHPMSYFVAVRQWCRVRVGVQNIHHAELGPYTGEISATMVRAAGGYFCLVGHSERRTLCYETDACVRAKVCCALAAGLKPILCIGETEEQRERGQVREVLRAQLIAALEGLDISAVPQLLVAYEPLWAIGTGRTATPHLAQEAHHICRECLEDCWGSTSARMVPLLYGGSVHSENAVALLKEPDVDGVLVGSASLDCPTFAHIVNCVEEYS